MLSCSRRFVRSSSAIRFVVVARGRNGTAANSTRRTMTSSSSNSTASSNNATAATSNSKFKTEAELQAYLRQANDTMQKYHETRELMRRGLLKSKNSKSASGGGTSGTAQLGIVAAFVAAFLATPFLGKKIARDEAFRERWVPKWYDYTVKKPENPWTRQELHEQMLAVQRDLHDRAIRGEFQPDKLEDLKRTLEREAFGHLHERRERQNRDSNAKGSSSVPKEWDRVHPLLDDDDDDE